MVVVAGRYLSNAETRAEIVQDAWEAIIRGLVRYESRGRLRSWVYAIVANKARTRAKRDARVTPLSAMGSPDDDGLADKFQADGHFLVPPAPWTRPADDQVHTREKVKHLMRCLDHLPEAQRAAVTLRDIDGLSTEDICGVLGVSNGNLRVLLHRGRCRLRMQLEAWDK